MSRIIPYLVSSVAGTSVADIDASGTLLTNGEGASYTFGCLALSQSGEPFKAHVVGEKNIRSLLGAPMHPREGLAAMSLRYVKEATMFSNGIVVPVVGTDARRPIIALKSDADPANPNVAVARVEPFTSDILLEVDELCAIYPVDGDVTNRKLSLTPNPKKAGFFNLLLVKVYPNGADEVQFNREVSFDFEALDEYGKSAYIEDVLDGSNILNIVVKENVDRALFTSLAEVAFSGGTRGDLNNVELTEYQRAVQVLKHDSREYTAVIGAGIQEATIINELQDVAGDRRIEAFFDVPSDLTYQQALDWMNSNNFESIESCFYHLPYKFNDLFFSGSKAIWGVSSLAFGAKVKGINEVGGSIGGWHKSPAGKVRGAISRQGAEPLQNVGEPDFKAMVTARINKVIPIDGRLTIDDALTATSAENYTKFQHVVSIFHAMSRRFNTQAQQLKHEDDGITRKGLEKIMKSIGDDFYGVSALVKPRNPEEDGEKPFDFVIEQKEIDLWHVTWYACPTGVARRIAGFPIAVQ